MVDVGKRPTRRVGAATGDPHGSRTLEVLVAGECQGDALAAPHSGLQAAKLAPRSCLATRALEHVASSPQDPDLQALRVTASLARAEGAEWKPCAP